MKLFRNSKTILITFLVVASLLVSSVSAQNFELGSILGGSGFDVAGGIASDVCAVRVHEADRKRSASESNANPPTFQGLVEAGNPNEATFGTDTNHHYYRNGTWQTEDWMYIKVNVTDTDGVNTVLVEWKNETQWHNYTMTREGATDFYYKNVTGQPRYDGYTFNIWANDSLGNMGKIYNWQFYDYESAWGTEEEWRKYVGLNSSPTDFSYEQFYFYEFHYGSDQFYDRCLPHEQPTDYSTVDTGRLLKTQPATPQERWCNSFVGLHIDETYEISQIVIDDLYLHVWWGSNFEYGGNQSTFGYKKATSDQMINDFDESYTAYPKNSRKNITISGFHQSNYYLHARFWDIDDPTFSDNDINLFCFKINDVSDLPSVISTLNYSSFILLNLPDNSTLQSLDTDSDGLNDYQELYTYYTDPKDSDTDNGGKNDYLEIGIGRDPLNPSDDTACMHATVDIDPNTLNLASTGKWITCCIELPEDYDVNDINVESILLNDDIPVDLSAPSEIGDHDKNGILDLMVKFDRSSVLTQQHTADYTIDTGKSYEDTIKVWGIMKGMPFEGFDIVRILNKG